MPRPRPSSLWRNAAFVKLWWAATASNFGSMIGRVALPFTAILVLEATPMQLALLGAAGLVPGFGVGWVAGAQLDRLRKRPVLVASDLLRASTLVTVPAAAALGVLVMEHLYAVALVNGLLGFLFDVTHASYLPSLVDRRELLDANTKLKAAEAVTEGGAFVAAGWLVQTLTAPIALLVDAASFLASALFLGGIRDTEPEPATDPGRRVLQEVAEGVRVVLRSPLLLPLGGSLVLEAFSFQVLGTVYLLYANQELGFEPGVLGVIFALGAASSFVGAVVAGRVTARLGLGAAMWMGLGLAAVSTLLLTVAPGATLAGALLLAAHQLGDGAEVVYQVNQMSLRLAVTPHRMLGRVNGSFQFAALGAMLLGSLVGGALGESVGLRATLLVAACGTGLGALWLVLSPVRALATIPNLESAPG